MALEVILPGDEGAINTVAEWVAAQDFERVLDVGGLEKPLRPATHVIDLYPYHGRRVDEGRGPLPERFTADTWWIRDINETPWPFPDGRFDFVWCCQVVEDIRDPVAACKEMMRVGKAGFISTVHRSYESHVTQYDGVVGYHHHRWLVEADPENEALIFTWKSPILHTRPALRPPHYRQWLLNIRWDDRFDVYERFTGGDQGQYAELREYLTRWNQ